MKKKLFEITEQEKKQILEKHNSLKESSKYNKDINLLFEQKPTPPPTTQTSGLPTWTNNYPCLLNSKLGKPVKTTSDNQVLISFSNGNKLYFWEKKCLHIDKNGEKSWGDWSCKNDKVYIKYDDGTVFDGDKVVKKPTTDNTTTNTGNSTNTGNRTTYTKCDETLPIKQFCKNETIRKVQACLKMPKRYQTGNFGPITQEYLESRDQNGTLITTETIIAVCGANDPLVKDTGTVATGTPAAGTPAKDGTTPTATTPTDTAPATKPDEIEQVDADDSIDLLK
jgi:hypothetical protein